MSKKDYRIDDSLSPPSRPIDGPCPWRWKTGTFNIDFTRWHHRYGDITQPKVERGQLLDECRNALWGLRFELSEASIYNLAESGIKTLFQFIDSAGLKCQQFNELSSDDFTHLVRYLKNKTSIHTGRKLSRETARRRYSAIKTILQYYARQGLFDLSVLPTVPFPNAKRATKGIQAYSKGEMRSIMRALNTELKSIRDGSSTLSGRIQMAVYYLLISAKTGINKTPLEEASRDCLQPHPLDPTDAFVILTHKRRGMNTTATTLRGTVQKDQIDRVPHSAERLIREAIKLSAPLVAIAPEHLKNRIWLYSTVHKSKVSAFKNTYLAEASKEIAKRHNLRDDSGAFMHITPNRLRKTFAERIWQLTNGDAWKTARILGNTPSVTDRHYLDVTPAMERNHKFLGLALEHKARGTVITDDVIARFSDDSGLSSEAAKQVLSGANNTGVSRCSDPVKGAFAAGNGEPCSRFLHCFRCPNQIVLNEDLHRLYSFYWLLLAQRPTLGRKRWKRLYGWVIREIDHGIAPNFSESEVAKAKDRARQQPHPMWRDSRILRGES